ncbi:MAG: tetratricopeptide repeat protein [Planctomycetota bacterium]|nr:tetratricopeptide repeat protein [Planctomycetota bacterium]MDA1177650.1 tetratricopeptide repeat protein [Planctomycetota bacterium]
MAIDRASPRTGSSAIPVDDPMPPAKRKQLQQCFERGNSMSRKDKPDHDYAHDMYSECVRQDPGNLVYVEAMLDNLQRKYKNNKKGASFKGFGGRSGFKKAVANQDWPEVYREGTELLKLNPWDVPTLRALADACRACRFNEVELRYLKNALDVNPKDVEVNRHCAYSLARMGQFDQSIACWHRIEGIDRNSDASKMISQLSMAKQKFAAGQDLDDLLVGLTGSSPPSKGAPRPSAPSKIPDTIPKVPDAASASAAPPDDNAAVGSANVTTSTERPKVEMTPRQSLELAIRQDPTLLENYVALSELLVAAGKFRDAQSVMEKALAASGGDIKFREKLEDVMILRQRADLAIAEKQVATGNHEEARELVKRLKEELNRSELDLYSQRVERYPNDAGLKLELGMRLKRAANYEAAIPLLEAARLGPDQQPTALLELGECQQYMKQYGRAVRTYQETIKAARGAGDLPRHKLALYRLGVLATALKEEKVALSALSALVEMDPQFRDAADRLDKLKQIEQNQ